MERWKQRKKTKQKQPSKSAQIYKGKKAGRKLFLVATHDCPALMPAICSWAKTFVGRQLIHNSNFKITSAFAHFKDWFFPSHLILIVNCLNWSLQNKPFFLQIPSEANCFQHINHVFQNSLKPEINWNAHNLMLLLTQIQKMSMTIAVSCRAEASQE